LNAFFLTIQATLIHFLENWKRASMSLVTKELATACQHFTLSLAGYKRPPEIILFVPLTIDKPELYKVVLDYCLSRGYKFAGKYPEDDPYCLKVKKI
jgi:hypothetical protein